jgi:D-arginine dehydrogenase
MQRNDVVVIGGGFAGASTAWWLRRRGIGRVTLLEQEEVPGAHASGKNAGIARQALSEPALTALAVLGTAFLRNPPSGFSDHPLFEPAGGFLLSTVPSDPRLDGLRRNALAYGVYTYPAERREVLGRASFLEGAPFRSALACPTDGLVDIHGLLSSYLRGTLVRTGVKVTGFEVRSRRVSRVLTSEGSLDCDWVVNAAGAWAPSVAAMAGGAEIPITPRRRHLVHTGPLDWVDPRGPYLWSLEPAVYLRPESSGLLLSPCDETAWPPGSPPADPNAASWLSPLLAQAFPGLADLPVATSWAELRCFAPDAAFVIGKDPRLANFLWVAGLGGHGMTTSAAVGELASALLLGQAPPVDPAPYDPGRFR